MVTVIEAFQSAGRQAGRQVVNRKCSCTKSMHKDPVADIVSEVGLLVIATFEYRIKVGSIASHVLNPPF